MKCGGFHSADAVEKVHLNFCKKVLKVKKTTTSNIVYGELGRFPLQLQRYFRIINYWLKIVCHKGNPLVCKMYDTLYKRLNEDENIINWASLTRNLLFKLGFADVWTAQGVGNTHRFLNICKQRLHDQFIQGWFGDMETGSDMELYRHVKVRFSYSLYFDVVTIPKYNMQCVNFLPEITGLQL